MSKHTVRKHYNKKFFNNVAIIECIFDNKYHNEEGPAIVYYHIDGSIKTEFYYINGILHRENGPAVQSFYENGKLALQSYYLNENLVIHREWHDNGLLCRQEYSKNGKFHSTDGPAIQEWSKKGKCLLKLYMIHGTVVKTKSIKKLKQLEKTLILK